MAWTTKSSPPQRRDDACEYRVETGLGGDIGFDHEIAAEAFSASGLTRLPSASP